MKKTSLLKLPFLFLAVLAFMLNSCKKETKQAVNPNSSEALTIAAAVDATSDDADAAVGNAKAFYDKYNSNDIAGLTGSAYSSLAPLNFFRIDLCGAVRVDTSTGPDHLVTITYDGYTKCHGIIRGGEITIAHTSSPRWDQPGGELTVNYINLTVKDISTGDQYTLNGTHLVTNETGGLAWKIIAQIVPSGTTVTHRTTSSNMSVAYPDGSIQTWNVDRTRSWNITGQVISVSVYGEGQNNITEIGVDRNGNKFNDQITGVIKASNVCTWNPNQGTFLHNVGSTIISVLYGTTSTGQQATGACGDGYYITTTTNLPGAGSSSVFVSY